MMTEPAGESGAGSPTGSAEDRASASASTVCCERQPPAGWNEYLVKWGYDGFHLRAEWGTVFGSALRHRPYFLWAEQHGTILGVLPLMFISGPLFGRFLVSQPYLNTGGVLADSESLARKLIDAAVSLAETLNVKQLELRHERWIEHSALRPARTDKVHLRLALPRSADELWDGLKSKVRSQIRRPLEDPQLQVFFGHEDRLAEFYAIFCRNMRDLGTPPFPKSLFGVMLREFGEAAEICMVTFQGKPVASGFLMHAPGVTLIPSASALREYNHTSCNMLMYWHMLKHTVERGQPMFDFGRSSQGSGTHKFKAQWGSTEHPAVWQSFVRDGSASELRPDNARFERMIRVWQRLPVWLTKLIGPTIVRGIP